MIANDIHILAIETSCDDTSAAVVKNGVILSNIIATQELHNKYGGVVPELASRAHQINIVPVVDEALKKASVSLEQLSAVAFTAGPGLIGSLLVGATFAKGLALSLNIPLIDVDHLEGHLFTAFIKENDFDQVPSFPFLSLTVSGGHTQLAVVNDFDNVEVLGKTIDDAAGEAFDKCAKLMGLGYPGGPIIDLLAKKGNPLAFHFPKPNIKSFDFSFSGLKTSFLYLLRDKVKEDNDFILKNKEDLAASIQKTIIDILIEKLQYAYDSTKIKFVTVGGGVAANSYFRDRLVDFAKKNDLKLFLPSKKYTTDNAAMIATVAFYKYLKGYYADLNFTPYSHK